MMEIQTELVTNIFTVLVGLILLAVIGLLIAFYVHTVRTEKALDESIAKKKADRAQQPTHKAPSLLIKHS